MAEQLGFEQFSRYRGAIEADEGIRVAQAVLVHGRGHQLLAGPVLSDDEDVGVGRRRGPRQAERLAHALCPGHQ